MFKFRYINVLLNGNMQMDKGRDRVNVQGVYRISIFYKIKVEVLRDFVFYYCYIINIIDDFLNIFELNKVSVLCLFEVLYVYFLMIFY